MARLQFVPPARGPLLTSAASQIAQSVAQSLFPTNVLQVQRLLQPDTAQKVSSSGSVNIQDTELELLGGMTLREARDLYEQMRDAHLARKNLFFLRVTDHNPPRMPYGDGAPLSGLFHLFAMDVSYGCTVTSEKVPIGGSVMHKTTGVEAIEMSITTTDDARGSLKRWFDAKVLQLVHDDGTFGLPWEAWVDIEVFHATPKADERSYKIKKRMMPQSAQHDLSRRDQGLSELQLVFAQFDTFFWV